MNLIKCNNNHYYDADKFPACPYCSDMQSGFSQTMPANEQSDIGPTQPETEVTTTTTQNTVPPTVLDTDIQKTVGFYEEDMGLEPVVGWLVCIEGNLIGKDFRLTSGRNLSAAAQIWMLCWRATRPCPEQRTPLWCMSLRRMCI